MFQDCDLRRLKGQCNENCVHLAENPEQENIYYLIKHCTMRIHVHIQLHEGPFRLFVKQEKLQLYCYFRARGCVLKLLKI
jgi:hypothetical protein